MITRSARGAKMTSREVGFGMTIMAGALKMNLGVVRRCYACGSGTEPPSPRQEPFREHKPDSRGRTTCHHALVLLWPPTNRTERAAIHIYGLRVYGKVTRRRDYSILWDHTGVIRPASWCATF